MNRFDAFLMSGSYIFGSIIIVAYYLVGLRDNRICHKWHVARAKELDRRSDEDVKGYADFKAAYELGRADERRTHLPTESAKV